MPRRTARGATTGSPSALADLALARAALAHVGGITSPVRGSISAETYSAVDS